MRLTVFAAALSLCLAGRAQSPSLLGTMRDESRPVLLFAGSGDRRGAEQYDELARHATELQDRQMRIVLLMHAPNTAAHVTLPGTVSATDVEASQLRSRFHVAPGTFALILVGKDGGEKYRSSHIISYRTLADIVDAMPMRRQEMHTR